MLAVIATVILLVVSNLHLPTGDSNGMLSFVQFYRETDGFNFTVTNTTVSKEKPSNEAPFKSSTASQTPSP